MRVCFRRCNIFHMIKKTRNSADPIVNAFTRRRLSFAGLHKMRKRRRDYLYSIIAFPP